MMNISACNRCGKRLSDPASVRMMYGPTCRAKVKTNRGGERIDAVELPFDPETMDIVCRRTAAGTAFNIPHALVLHSPDGMEWGYGGSGPSDFALNILFRFTQDRRFSERWHQEFKWDFVAGLDRDGGTISGADILVWIQDRRQIPHSQLELAMGGGKDRCLN